MYSILFKWCNCNSNLMQYTVTCAVKYHRIYLYGNCEQELYTLHELNKCLYMSICLHNGFVVWNAWLQQT